MIYTAARLGLFLATYAVLAGVWMSFSEVDATTGFIILVMAAVISSILSLRFLAGPRERFAAKVQERATRATAKFEEMRAKEDADRTD